MAVESFLFELPVPRHITLSIMRALDWLPQHHRPQPDIQTRISDKLPNNAKYVDRGRQLAACNSQH